MKKKKQLKNNKTKPGKISYIGDYFQYRDYRNSYDHFLNFDYVNGHFFTLSKMLDIKELSIKQFYIINQFKTDLKRII